MFDKKIYNAETSVSQVVESISGDELTYRQLRVSTSNKSQLFVHIYLVVSSFNCSNMPT